MSHFDNVYKDNKQIILIGAVVLVKYFDWTSEWWHTTFKKIYQYQQNEN